VVTLHGRQQEINLVCIAKNAFLSDSRFGFTAAPAQYRSFILAKVMETFRADDDEPDEFPKTPYCSQ